MAAQIIDNDETQYKSEHLDNNDLPEYEESEVNPEEATLQLKEPIEEETTTDVPDKSQSTSFEDAVSMTQETEQ